MSGRNGSSINYGAVDDTSVAVLDTRFNQEEFSTLCENIGSNIYLVQSNATTLEKIKKQIGTPSDDESLRDKIHVIQARCNQTIKWTARVVSEAMILSRLGQEHHKVQSERLRNKFQNEVQGFSNVQKQVAQTIKTAYLRPVPARDELTSPTSDWTEDSDQTQILDNVAAQQQAQRQLAASLELHLQHAFIVERDERIRQIVADMSDIDDILRTVAVMVDREDLINNIEQAQIDVDAGEQQLLLPSTFQQKHRRKLLTLFILFTVAIVVVIVVVLIEYT